MPDALFAPFADPGGEHLLLPIGIWYGQRFVLVPFGYGAKQVESELGIATIRPLEALDHQLVDQWHRWIVVTRAGEFPQHG